jgi:hypothetical protein
LADAAHPAWRGNDRAARRPTHKPSFSCPLGRKGGSVARTTEPFLHARDLTIPRHCQVHKRPGFSPEFPRNSSPCTLPSRCCSIPVMEDSERTVASCASSQKQLASSVWLRPAKWLPRFSVLLLAGFVAYCWAYFSNALFMRTVHFARTRLGPGEAGARLPIDYEATVLAYLGPLGWIVALGVFGVALIMALTVYRWPWPLRVIVVVAPIAPLLRQACVADLRPEIRPIWLSITVVELLLAALVAALCRPIARRLRP